MCPTLLSVILNFASLISEKWVRNGEALWSENGRNHKATPPCVREMLSVISHLCGFISCNTTSSRKIVTDAGSSYCSHIEQ